MASKKQNGNAAVQATTQVEVVLSPKCIPIAEEGIKTASQFVGFMSALMADIVTGRVTPQMANATANVSSKMLKGVELNHRHRQMSKEADRSLNLLD